MRSANSVGGYNNFLLCLCTNKNLPTSEHLHLLIYISFLEVRDKTIYFSAKWVFTGVYVLQ